MGVALYCVSLFLRWFFVKVFDSMRVFDHGFEWKPHFESFFMFSFIQFKCMLICLCEVFFFDILWYNGAATSFFDVVV